MRIKEAIDFPASGSYLGGADTNAPVTTDMLNIYADGSFDATSGLGGWAFEVMDEDRNIYKTAGVMTGSSNNTFEILSVVKAILWFESTMSGKHATIWTDSIHVTEGCDRWRFIWRGNGWKRVRANANKRRRSIPDVSLWQQLDAALDRNPYVRIEICKGHSGIQGNENVDAAAKEAMIKGKLAARFEQERGR